MIRWGVIGVGNIAVRFIKSLSYSTSGKLVAIASKKDHVRKAYSHIKTYENYQDLLLDEEIDAVYIALPNKLHYYWSMEALKAKKAVLCEKPVTLTKQEIVEITTLAEIENTFFMEAMKTKFTPAFKLLKEELSKLDLDKLTTIEMSFCDDSLESIDANSYFFDIEQGGAWYDIASYCISFLHTFIKEEPVSIHPTVLFKNHIDIDTRVQLNFKDNKQALINISKINPAERNAFIKLDDTIIKVEVFNRTESFVITTNGISKEYQSKLIIDDFFAQIEEVHTCLVQERIESSIHSFDDMINDVELLEKVSKVIHNR